MKNYIQFLHFVERFTWKSTAATRVWLIWVFESWCSYFFNEAADSQYFLLIFCIFIIFIHLSKKGKRIKTRKVSDKFLLGWKCLWNSIYTIMGQLPLKARLLKSFTLNINKPLEVTVSTLEDFWLIWKQATYEHFLVEAAGTWHIGICHIRSVRNIASQGFVQWIWQWQLSINV